MRTIVCYAAIVLRGAMSALSFTMFHLKIWRDLPRLPSDYPGSFGLAAIPWLWFKVVAPKRMARAAAISPKSTLIPEERQPYAMYAIC